MTRWLTPKCVPHRYLYVSLHVCVIDMGMDVHACITSALTCDLKREKRERERERERARKKHTEREIQYSYKRMTNVCIGEVIGKSLDLEPQYNYMIPACVRVLVHTHENMDVSYIYACVCNAISR